MHISTESLHQFLSTQLGASITDITPARHGEWSQTFFFSADRRRKVIRFSLVDEDFQKDRFAAQFSSPALPIPPIEKMGAAFDRFYAISPYVPGKMIDHLTNVEMHAALPALLDLFDALREVDGSLTSGYGGFDHDGNAGATSWREYLTMIPHNSPESRLYGWQEHMANDPTVEEVYRQGRQRLLDRIPLCPEERHLVHNDLLHFNLIMHGARVGAVIDWGCALWGDFLYDLAMFTTWQFYYPAMAGINFAEAARQFFQTKNVPVVNFDARLQCYQIHLLLDGLVYNTWKGDHNNQTITIHRLKELMNDI